MPRPIITGTLQPVKQPTEYNYDPTRGLWLTERWESAGDNLRGIASQYQALRVGYQLIATAAKSTLVATSSNAESGQPEATTDTWQILGNELQKDAWQHPTLFAYANAAGTAAAAQSIKTAIASHSTQPAGLDATGQAIYALLDSGATHYSLGQYVLRHTTNVSNGYATNVSDFNVEKIYTTAKLLIEAQDGSLWYFPLPGRLAAKINNIAAPAVKAGYLWGWRKLPSTETTAANNRIDITTEYWLEQWSTLLYGVV